MGKHLEVTRRKLGALADVRASIEASVPDSGR